MSRRKAIIGAIFLVVFTFLATAGVFLHEFGQGTADTTGTVKFFQALKVVKSGFVEDVPIDVLINGAIKGMVSALNDPHSVYMDPKMYNKLKTDTEGSFGGVGIVVGMKDKVLTVIAPIEGTPGDKAGIKSGDQIIKIDGAETKDLVMDEAVDKIRGPEGSKVVLSIRRGDEPLKDYELVRSNIPIKTVAGKMLADNIGYIRISMFNENTSGDFFKVYEELEGKGMKALVLDLRDDPGGLLKECVKVAGKLVPKGPIVSVVERSGEKKTEYSSLEAVKYPLVVLVNGGSASASEIVAGAVQDTGAGVLVGTKTYGKGSVQTIIPLVDNGKFGLTAGEDAIKLTIAKYLTPNGRSINGIGIEPDVKIELPDGAEKDVQLDKAIEIIKTKM
jgi:carboxyl-terminal processing protease